MRRRFADDMFGFTVWVLIGPHDELRAFVKRRFKVDMPAKYKGASTTTFCRSGGDANLVLWFGSKPGVGMITHEATHAANMVLMSAGVRTSQRSDEALAYYASWVARRVGRIAWAKQKPRRKGSKRPAP